MEDFGRRRCLVADDNGSRECARFRRVSARPTLWVALGGSWEGGGGVRGGDLELLGWMQSIWPAGDCGSARLCFCLSRPEEEEARGGCGDRLAWRGDEAEEVAGPAPTDSERGRPNSGGRTTSSGARTAEDDANRGGQRTDASRRHGRSVGAAWAVARRGEETACGEATARATA